MKLTFLGTGGGRFCMVEQLRKTGGMFLELKDFKLYIDPGPGALVNSLEKDIDITELDAILVSHPHLDHYNDVEVMIEGLTEGCQVERGRLLGNKGVFEGNKKSPEPVVTEYHREALEEVEELGEGDSTSLGVYELECIENKHRYSKPISFKISNEEESIGFITDSEYMEKFGEFFKGVDYLVMNIMRPKDKKFEGHLSVQDSAKLINKIDPEIAILTHFGRYMIYSSTTDQKEWLEENTDTETEIIFAKDFQEINFNEKGSLESFIE